MQTRIEIGFSTRKAVLALLGSLALVAASAVMYLDPAAFEPLFGAYASLISKVAATLGVAFFGACAIVLVGNLRRTGPGFTIDDRGLTDASTPTSVGLVPWRDIRSIDSVRVSGVEMLRITLRNPDWYVARSGSWWVRLGMRFNRRFYGSPVLVSTNPLAVSYPEFSRLVLKEFSAHRLA